MSSEDEDCLESTICIPEELTIILLNEEFQELSQYLHKSHQEDLAKFNDFLPYAFKTLVKSSNYSQALNLMVEFADLLEGPLPSPLIIDQFFKVVREGSIPELEEIIEAFGFYPEVTSCEGRNLFSEAVYSEQFLMLKYLREELGVECREEHNLIKAAELGSKNILKYLYEELGIESTNYDLLIRNVVESGSLDCLKYARFTMGIVKLTDYRIMESAINSSVVAHTVDLLDFLLTYFVIDFEPSRIPPYRKNTIKQTSLFSSLLRAVQHNDLNTLNYMLHVVKLELSTDSSESELNCYLEYLQIAVKKGNLEILKFFIEDAQLQPGLLPKLNQDELMVTVYNSKLEIPLKKQILQYLQMFDKDSNYDHFIAKIEEEDFANNAVGSPYKKPKIEESL